MLQAAWKVCARTSSRASRVLHADYDTDRSSMLLQMALPWRSCDSRMDTASSSSTPELQSLNGRDASASSKAMACQTMQAPCWAGSS